MTTGRKRSLHLPVLVLGLVLTTAASWRTFDLATGAPKLPEVSDSADAIGIARFAASPADAVRRTGINPNADAARRDRTPYSQADLDDRPPPEDQDPVRVVVQVTAKGEQRKVAVRATWADDATPGPLVLAFWGKAAIRDCNLRSIFRSAGFDYETSIAFDAAGREAFATPPAVRCDNVDGRSVSLLLIPPLRDGSRQVSLGFEGSGRSDVFATGGGRVVVGAPGLANPWEGPTLGSSLVQTTKALTETDIVRSCGSSTCLNEFAGVPSPTKLSALGDTGSPIAIGEAVLSFVVDRPSTDWLVRNSDPAVTRNDATRTQWIADGLDGAIEATFESDGGKRRADRWLFLAGVLAGLGGGFVLELLGELSGTKERGEKEQAGTA